MMSGQVYLYRNKRNRKANRTKISNQVKGILMRELIKELIFKFVFGFLFILSVGYFIKSANMNVGKAFAISLGIATGDIIWYLIKKYKQVKR